MFELLLHQYMPDEFLKRIKMRKIKRARISSSNLSLCKLLITLAQKNNINSQSNKHRLKHYVANLGQQIKQTKT